MPNVTYLASTIANFPFMSSNIPSAPVYGVYASQLICYARCCSNYSEFLSRHRVLSDKTSFCHRVTKLIVCPTYLRNSMANTDLIGQYKKNVCQMFADSIS